MFKPVLVGSFLGESTAASIASSRPISLRYQLDSQRLSLAHFASLSCGLATQLTIVTLAQACAFSSASFCKFNQPQNRLDSSCWKPSVLAEYNLYCFATVLLKIIIKELFDFFFFQSINALNHCWLHIMRKEWHKVTYTPHHKLSWFSLICDKQTELSECASWPMCQTTCCGRKQTERSKCAQWPMCNQQNKPPVETSSSTEDKLEEIIVSIDQVELTYDFST